MGWPEQPHSRKNLRVVLGASRAAYWSVESSKGVHDGLYYQLVEQKGSRMPKQIISWRKQSIR